MAVRPARARTAPRRAAPAVELTSAAPPRAHSCTATRLSAASVTDPTGGPSTNPAHQLTCARTPCPRALAPPSVRARALSVQLSRVAVEEGGEIPALVDQQSDDASPFFRVEYQRRDAILAHLVPYSFMTRLMTFAATPSTPRPPLIPRSVEAAF